jgi:pyruvate formate lyase activating enzyme
MADFAAGLGNVERVDVLPFHQLGRYKWERLGMEYQLQDAESPSHKTVAEVSARFRAVGLTVI